MAGERTPSSQSGPNGFSSSSDDEISLREHMQRQIDVFRSGAQIRIAEEREHTDEKIASTKELLEKVVADLAFRLDERFTVAIKMTTDRDIEKDKRYDQRFQAQEQAVQLALARVDKEFHEHLQSVREETSAALDAADKAINKSEVSIEKRFDAVNEFRAQLADQASSFMPRKESDVRMDAVTEKIDANANRINELQLRMTSRLDINQGQVAGGREAIMDKRTANGAVLALVGMGITIFLAALTVIGFVIANGSP